LLLKLPHECLESPSSKTYMKPKDFVTGSTDEIQQTIVEVKKKYLVGDPVRLAWDDWIRTWCPPNDDAANYVKFLKDNHLSYHMPLRSFLLSDARCNPSWVTELANTSELEPEFNWPDVLAAAMPSVVTRFDKHPPDPRLLVLSVSDLQSKMNNINEVTIIHMNI
jgi:hypothetical protein